ncbi:hypothetical protein ACW7BJ_16500 [Azospirillum argentinense]
MAMVKCGECGRDISSLATACPGCGVPRPIRKKTSFVKVLFSLMAIAFVVWAINFKEDPSTKETGEPSPDRTSRESVLSNVPDYDHLQTIIKSKKPIWMALHSDWDEVTVKMHRIGWMSSYEVNLVYKYPPNGVEQAESDTMDILKISMSEMESMGHLFRSETPTTIIGVNAIFFHRNTKGQDDVTYYGRSGYNFIEKKYQFLSPFKKEQ